MEMKFLNKGSFTTAYLLNNGRVYLKSCDPVKECMANGWFPKSNLFPKINFFGNEIGEYEMRYYPRVRSLKNSLKPSHYEFYKELRKIHERIFWDGKDVRDSLKTIKCRRKRQILIDAAEACMAYGEVAFEISPRNVATSPTGGLVLMDCFFIREKLEEVYKSKR